MRQFKGPGESLAGLDAGTVAMLVASAADVALVLDDRGRIRDRAFLTDEFAADLVGADEWIGRDWIDTVTIESRPKIEEMMAAARRGEVPRRRQVNHPGAGRIDVPVIYSTVTLGPDRIVALGRDLLPIAQLQQRLVEAQAAMERDYGRFRQVDMRYRMLFDVSPEALIVVDHANLRVVDANPAARQRFEGGGRKVVGRGFPGLFDELGQESVQMLLAGTRASGRSDSVRATVAGGGGDVLVTANPMRQDGATLFLVRVAGAASGDIVVPKLKSKLLKIVENAPDAIVVTSAEGEVITSNAAFLDLVHLATEEQIRGEKLDRWLGRPGIDLEVLTANLKRHGSVRLFGTTLRAEYGATVDVEVSAVAVMNGGRTCCGFSIRNVSRRLSAEGSDVPMSRSVEQLKELIGRVPLKDLVRETTDLIERHCIEAALELTGDSRASAAEMLGLSRQSLYIKLRRYGIAEFGAEGE